MVAAQRQAGMLDPPRDVQGPAARLELQLLKCDAVVSQGEARLDVLIGLSGGGQLQHTIAQRQLAIDLWLLQRPGDVQVDTQDPSALRHGWHERPQHGDVERGRLQARVECAGRIQPLAPPPVSPASQALRSP